MAGGFESVVALVLVLCAYLIVTPWDRYYEYYETCEMVCPPHSYACDSLNGLKLCEIAKCDVCVRHGTLVCASKESVCFPDRRMKEIDSPTKVALYAWTIFVVVGGMCLTGLFVQYGF